MIQNNKGSFSEDSEFEKQSKEECIVSKFDFKKKYLIIYLFLIAFDAFLMLCRWLEHIVPNVRLLPDFLFLHIPPVSCTLVQILYDIYISICCVIDFLCHLA